MRDRQAQTLEAQTSRQPDKQIHKQPRRRDLLFHVFKSMRLIGAVLKDQRVSLLRKGAYLGGMALLLVLLLFPEVLADGATLLTPLFSLVGVELPTEGSLDWLALAFASFSLLSLFPKEILGEHYERIFHR
ncbi:MAG TPA: hypothetical protein VKT82_22280 [Ktedonobacterales bacterium]|nr:hypothetical protein [Ktedonobacterales bacterium]